MRVFNPERALKVLLEGTFVGDGVAAKKYGVASVTVSAWRKRLSEDEELSLEYEKRLEAYRERWLEHAPATLTAGLLAFRRVAEYVAQNPQKVDAEVFSSLIQGIQTVSRVTISQRYADVKLEDMRRRLTEPVETKDDTRAWLPDVQQKQIEAYHPSQNGHNSNDVITITPESEN